MAPNFKLYLQYSADIRKIAEYEWVPDLDPDDIESELKLRLINAKLNFKHKNGAAPRTYVLSILKNGIKDLRRRAGRDTYITNRVYPAGLEL